MFQTLAQFVVEISIFCQHAGRFAVIKVLTALCDLFQGKRLLTCLLLNLFRVFIIADQRFVLLRITLENSNHRLQLAQCCAVLLDMAGRLLCIDQCIADLIRTIRQCFIKQQSRIRDQTVQDAQVFFDLRVLLTGNGSLILKLRQFPLQLITALIQCADFCFRISLKGHRDIFTDETAECLVGTLHFLDIKGERCQTFCQLIPFMLQHRQLIFPRRTAEQRH